MRLAKIGRRHLNPLQVKEVREVGTDCDEPVPENCQTIIELLDGQIRFAEERPDQVAEVINLALATGVH